MRAAVIFGGAGFVGSHLAPRLIEDNFVEKVYLADISFQYLQEGCYRSNLIAHYDCRLVNCDVRFKIESDIVDDDDEVVLIINCAAIHREPGHSYNEYFETNIPGAENVCEYAARVGCKAIVFTSSIAPYGNFEGSVDEDCLLIPSTPYGISKLTAEQVHLRWFEQGNHDRSLLILRPGVVYGPTEFGNVSRMVAAVNRGYFAFIGNRKTSKASIYIEELVNITSWGIRLVTKNNANKTFNCSTITAPRMEDFVVGIQKVTGSRRLIPSVPLWSVLVISRLISLLGYLLRFEHPFSPVRIRKACKSNNVVPTNLIQEGYQWEYNLETSLHHWKENYPEEWSDERK